MTDRRALARVLADEAERRGQPGLVERFARVLAEHETAHEAERTRALLQGTVKGYAAGENAPSKLWRERAEAAEARCAQLEQALRDLIDAIPEETLDADPPLRAWVRASEDVLPSKSEAP